MANQYWNGFSWRRISEVEARLRRARGENVVSTTAESLEAPPAPLPVKSLADLPPVTVVLPDVVQAYSPPLPPLKLPADDLTDDELERLTAPGGEG